MPGHGHEAGHLPAVAGRANYERARPDIGFARPDRPLIEVDGLTVHLARSGLWKTSAFRSGAIFYRAHRESAWKDDRRADDASSGTCPERQCEVLRAPICLPCRRQFSPARRLQIVFRALPASTPA